MGVSKPQPWLPMRLLQLQLQQTTTKVTTVTGPRGTTDRSLSVALRSFFAHLFSHSVSMMAAMEWVYHGRLSALKGSTQRVFKGDTILHDDERSFAPWPSRRGPEAARPIVRQKCPSMSTRSTARPSRWRSNGEQVESCEMVPTTCKQYVKNVSKYYTCQVFVT